MHMCVSILIPASRLFHKEIQITYLPAKKQTTTTIITTTTTTITVLSQQKGNEITCIKCIICIQI